jgi:hypothetical protein
MSDFLYAEMRFFYCFSSQLAAHGSQLTLMSDV